MKKRIRLTFPQDLIKEPVIYTVARKYDIIPNIRRARVTESVGEMILELDGQEDNLNLSIEALKETGVDVELVEGDIIQ
ncbi:MAG: NIL domain-containing protein [Nitrospirota bacterium]|uniref:NIL domain protein n=1 Tax=Candidatus Magnetominusculus xianensis TaxID=1748249 RepID=A0ABR5SGW3_9BACT|nr:NIL domain-containing protein [Candidatus Magnetominusculus xianensis]KWT86773.1 NIL domain protein [Candidatus Magnetominusculus xianensis]MBF0402509.1 NIL domain-containing protein [Nitrospirota bacterium]